MTEIKFNYRPFNADELILAVDSHYGIYTPQTAMERYMKYAIDLKDHEAYIEILSNPENEYYWELYENMLDTWTIVIEGKAYNFFSNEDLWLIPIDMKIDDDWII